MEGDSAIINQGGWFDLQDRPILGYLTIRGAQTSLRLNDGEFFHFDESDCRYISGALHDLRKISLIDCFSTGLNRVWSHGETQHYCDVIPHHAVVGHRHLDPTEEAVRQVSLLIDDAKALFPDTNAFGRAYEADKHIEALAQDYEQALNRPLRRGPSPVIYFFGGEPEVCSVETVIGKVSVRHRHSFRHSVDANDFGFTNRTWIELEFEDSINFDDSIERAGTLLRFIEIMAGRPQNIERMTIYAPLGQNEHSLDVYSIFESQRSQDWENPRVSLFDLVIDPIADRSGFETLMKNWLELDIERRTSRCRSSLLLGRQRTFDPDRLVGAANMFDLLPDDALPPKPVLTEDVLKAKQAAEKAFKELPDSDEKQSVLSALGRIGTQTLRQKIYHRAKVVDDRIRPRLPHLDLVVREAVTMRNHFVHGSPPGFDYNRYSGMSSFLTEALEFIFTASDLVDAGWPIQKWYMRLSNLSHPLKLLVKSWDSQTAILLEAKGKANSI